MEKEKTMLATSVEPIVFNQFKAALQFKGITISEWLESKIVEEAKTIYITKV